MARDFTINQISLLKDEIRPLLDSRTYYYTADPSQLTLSVGNASSSISVYPTGTIVSNNYSTTGRYTENELYYFIIKPKNANKINYTINAFAPNAAVSYLSLYRITDPANLYLLEQPIVIAGSGSAPPEFQLFDVRLFSWTNQGLSFGGTSSSSHLLITWSSTYDAFGNPIILDGGLNNEYKWKIDWTSDGIYEPTTETVVPLRYSIPGPLSFKGTNQYKISRG